MASNTIWMQKARGESHMADGRNWMERAFAKNKGGLHRSLGVPEGQTIPAGKVAAAAHSGDSKTRHQAQAAMNANPGRYGQRGR